MLIRAASYIVTLLFATPIIRLAAYKGTTGPIALTAIYQPSIIETQRSFHTWWPLLQLRITLRAEPGAELCREPELQIIFVQTFTKYWARSPTWNMTSGTKSKLAVCFKHLSRNPELTELNQRTIIWTKSLLLMWLLQYILCLAQRRLQRLRRIYWLLQMGFLKTWNKC